MLTYEDCLGLCELSADEIAAIARHEHLPEIVALELGAHLVRSPQGRRTILAMIEDDIAMARERGDGTEAARLDLMRREFGAGHAMEGTLEQRVRALGFGPAAAGCGSACRPTSPRWLGRSAWRSPACASASRSSF